jgi:hypothetical protein
MRIGQDNKNDDALIKKLSVISPSCNNPDCNNVPPPSQKKGKGKRREKEKESRINPLELSCGSNFVL